MGAPSCLSLFGRDAKRHQLLSEHLAAEFRVKTTAYDRTVAEWKLRASRPDNRWLDCLIGAAVANSIQGATLSSLSGVPGTPRERIKLSQLQRGRRQ